MDGEERKVAEGSWPVSSSASNCSGTSRAAGKGPERVKKVESEHRNFLNDGTQAGGLGLRRGVEQRLGAPDL